jgi:hypothetical protein
VMYDPVFVPDLLNVIEALLLWQQQEVKGGDSSSSSSSGAVAYVAATRRNEATLGVFHAEVKARPLSCVEVPFMWPESAARPFFYESAAVLLFEIRYENKMGRGVSGGMSGGEVVSNI